MNCIFQKNNNQLVCINCGFNVPYKKYKGGLHRNCTKPCKGSKLKNFIQEGKKQISHIAEGVLAEGKDIQERLDICKECPHFVESKCELCGCFMNFKVRLKHSNCPIGKW